MKKDKNEGVEHIFSQHKYDVDIIDIFFTLTEKCDKDKSNTKCKSIINRYKEVIEFIIKDSGYECDIFFEQKLPFVLYSEDNSFDLFLALKLITSKEYLIEPILNFQHHYAENKEVFVNKLEFYVIRSIENNNYLNNKNIIVEIFKWINKIRDKHCYTYISKSNQLYLSDELSKNKLVKEYAYPKHIKNIKENAFFNLFVTESYFDKFLRKIIKLKIIDNECNWITDKKVSKIIVNVLYSLSDKNIINDRHRNYIADTLIYFFNIGYSVESARRPNKTSDDKDNLYEEIKQFFEDETL